MTFFKLRNSVVGTTVVMDFYFLCQQCQVRTSWYLYLLVLDDQWTSGPDAAGSGRQPITVPVPVLSTGTTGSTSTRELHLDTTTGGRSDTDVH
jgi:hypothetical protein